MAGVYDIESFLEDIRTLLGANLNTYIDRVNTDKGDTLLEHVDSDQGYFLQNLGQTTVNVNPFLLYGIANPVTESIGQGLAVKYETYAMVVVTDAGNDPDIVKRLFRYQRALTDVFRAHWGSFSRGGVKPKISKLNPYIPELVGIENAGGVGVILSFTME